MAPSSGEYNFSKPIKRVEIDGQEGQPVLLDEEIFKHKAISDGFYIGNSGCQVSSWQSATLQPVQPVPARVEEPVRQSSSGGATHNPPFAKMHGL